MRTASGKLPVLIGVAVVLAQVLSLGVVQPARAAGALSYKGVDVMKWTKDTVRNQPSDAEIEGVVSAIMAQIHPSHIAISVPLDADADYGSNPPSPRTAVQFSQKWSDTIHGQGAKVVWRGTFNGIEGIYDFPQKVGGNRFPAGTAASAATDGSSTWLGKVYGYIVSNPGLFQDGDVWAILPERTEGIFQDSTSFLSYSGSGIQQNYAQFFIDLKAVSQAAFNHIGKNVTTGMTANNFSEVNSGWLPQSLFDATGYEVVDHYGITHTAQEMDSDLRRIYSMHGKPVFLQEWGDYWNSGLSSSQRTSYLNSMYSTLSQLVSDGVLVGFNYWGAWENSGEGILAQSGNQFQINSRGDLLASFFGTAQQSVSLPPPLADTTAPSLSISAPIGGSSISGVVSVTATATDNVGVAGVQFKIDGSDIGAEDTSAPFSAALNTVGYSNGTSHTLTAVARDAAGNTATSPAVIITVNNVAAYPTPSYTYPTPYAYPTPAYATPAPVTSSAPAPGVASGGGGGGGTASPYATPYPTPYVYPTPVYPTPAPFRSKTQPDPKKVILPHNVREGQVVKFGRNPTVYLVQATGLYPFDNYSSYLAYIKQSGQRLRVFNTPASYYTILSIPARYVLADHSLALAKPLGSVLGTATSFPTGTIVEDKGALYIFINGEKALVTNMEAFTGLGYSLHNVVSADDNSAPVMKNYRIESTSQGHPYGAWVERAGVIYYVIPQGMVPVPDYDTFLHNGGRPELVLPANSVDQHFIETRLLSPMLYTDPRVMP